MTESEYILKQAVQNVVYRTVDNDFTQRVMMAIAQRPQHRTVEVTEQKSDKPKMPIVILIACFSILVAMLAWTYLNDDVASAEVFSIDFFSTIYSFSLESVALIGGALLALQSLLSIETLLKPAKQS